MQPTQLPKSNSWWIDALLLTLTLGSLFFILLGTRPLWVPDEGRYAEITREMLASGDYVTPYLNGIKYFEKPILFYWMGSAAIKIGGLNLWSIRSINALVGLIGCLLTYITARKLYNRATGLLAAFILGTSGLYFFMVHMINLDLTITVFLATCLYAFLLGSQLDAGIVRRFYFWIAAAAAALAVLTKGLIGIVFPIIIIGTWIALISEWRTIKRLYLPSCLLIFLLIAGPWHTLVGQRNPDFFYFYFIEQHLLRYATMDAGRYQPLWFFIPILIVGFFPWIVFLPQAIATSLPSNWKQRSERKIEIFFLLWAILVFAFFSFSKSKLIPYILPVFPPLAILTGRYLSQRFDRKFNLGIRAGYACLILLTVIIAYVFYFFVSNFLLPDPYLAHFYFYLATMVLMIGSLAGCLYAYRNICKAITITIAASYLFLLITLAGIPSIDTRTILPLVTILKPILRLQDEVITYNQYYQDLPFYLERRVSILNWQNELSYGMKHQDSHEWMIDNNTFWQRWHSTKRVFAVMSIDEYLKLRLDHHNEKIILLGKTINNVLISNS